MMNSDEVNYIVWRYLQESGFEHTTFAFKNEFRNMEMLETKWAPSVSAGMLINVLQKGLQYMEVEAMVDENGVERELQGDPPSLIPGYGRHKLPSPVLQANGLSGKSKISVEKDSSDQRGAPMPAISLTNRNATITTNGNNADINANTNTNTNTDGIRDQVMTDSVQAMSIVDRVVTFTERDATLLEGHDASVAVGRWHPVQKELLATSSADGTCRIWTVTRTKHEAMASLVLPCTPSRTEDRSVTALEWSPSGMLLATGSFDGQARLWSSSGRLQHILALHNGPIFAVKWNSTGNLVATGSADAKLAVWDASTGACRQSWKTGGEEVIDVEWVDEHRFLSGCKNGSLDLWQVGEDGPQQRFEGHGSDINYIKWDPVSRLAATCSDDRTAKVWTLESAAPQHTFANHADSVINIQWSTDPSRKTRLLATCSRDSTVSLWDVSTGKCLHILCHDLALFTISFSPDGRTIACGGEDGTVSLWEVSTGRPLSTFASGSVVYDVEWSRDGKLLMVCRQKPTVGTLFRLYHGTDVVGMPFGGWELILKF